MVVRGVVVADAGVVAARAELQVVVRRVLEEQPVDFERELVALVRVNDQLAEDAELIRQARRDEEVELAERERSVAALFVARAQVNIGEALNL